MHRRQIGGVGLVTSLALHPVEFRPGAVVLSKARLKATGLVVAHGNHTRLFAGKPLNGRGIHERRRAAVDIVL